MRTTTEDKILKYIRKHRQVKPGVLANYLQISRVAIHKQLKNLLLKEKIEKYGTSPHVQYSILQKKKTQNPHYLWDYDYDELKKTEQGRIKILERMINYGPGEGEKINLADVKKYWDKLKLFPNAKRLMELMKKL